MRRRLVPLLVLLSSSSCFLTLSPLPEQRPVAPDPAACVPGRVARGAADILFVVDNSAEMAVAQQRLKAAFFNDLCTITDLDDVPDALRDPGPDDLGECGFVQLLAAHGLDFRIGVITSTVTPCDNFFPAAQGSPPDWGFRRQRGCLQPDGAPDDGDLATVIAAGDADVVARFGRTIDNIGTFGTGVERALDAAALFLDAESARPPECANDLAAFRRADASLTLIFLSTEDDCSHGLGETTFPEETDGLTCGEETAFLDDVSSDACYSDRAGLTPLVRYREAFQRQDAAVKLAVIGGVLDGAAAGCSAEFSDACMASNGQTRQTASGQFCDPDGPNFPCCDADGGVRWVDIARGVEAQSICTSDLRPALRAVATAIAVDECE